MDVGTIFIMSAGLAIGLLVTLIYAPDQRKKRREAENDEKIELAELRAFKANIDAKAEQAAARKRDKRALAAAARAKAGAKANRSTTKSGRA